MQDLLHSSPRPALIRHIIIGLTHQGSKVCKASNATLECVAVSQTCSTLQRLTYNSPLAKCFVTCSPLKIFARRSPRISMLVVCNSSQEPSEQGIQYHHVESGFPILEPPFNGSGSSKPASESFGFRVGGVSDMTRAAGIAISAPSTLRITTQAS